MARRRESPAGVAASGVAGSENVEAACPMSTAMACSVCARCHAHVDRLGLRRLELGFRLEDVCTRHDTTRVLILSELEGLLERGDGRVQELLLRIECPQLEVVLRQRCL